MLKISLTVRTPDDARSSIENLCASLDKSDLPSPSKIFLIDAVRETLEIWEAQLTRPTIKALNAERLFEGLDYRVMLRVRSSPMGIVSRLRKTFRIG